MIFYHQIFFFGLQNKMRKRTKCFPVTIIKKPNIVFLVNRTKWKRERYQFDPRNVGGLHRVLHHTGSHLHLLSLPNHLRKSLLDDHDSPHVGTRVLLVLWSLPKLGGPTGFDHHHNHGIASRKGKHHREVPMHPLNTSQLWNLTGIWTEISA